MKYERSSQWKYRYINSFSMSCAFEELRGQFNKRTFWRDGTAQLETDEEHQQRLWENLCGALTASESRPVFISTTSKEDVMEDLLTACPYVEPVVSQQSRHGQYFVTIWLIRKHRSPK